MDILKLMESWMMSPLSSQVFVQILERQWMLFLPDKVFFRAIVTRTKMVGFSAENYATGVKILNSELVFERIACLYQFLVVF